MRLQFVHMPEYPATVYFLHGKPVASNYWESAGAQNACPLVCCYDDVLHILWPKQLAHRTVQMTDSKVSEVIVDSTSGGCPFLDVHWGVDGKALYWHRQVGFLGAGPLGDLMSASALAVYLPGTDGHPALVGRWPVRVLARALDGSLVGVGPS
jgi:hypothetical protein